MAYLARIESDGADAIELPAIATTGTPVAGFLPLEWAIIRDARGDRLWTIRPVGALRRWWEGLLGRGIPKLANERLETLRRMAVLSWNYGRSVAGQDIEDFLAAGFTPDQYELLVGSVRAALRPSPSPQFVRAAA